MDRQALIGSLFGAGAALCYGVTVIISLTPVRPRVPNIAADADA